MTALALVTPSYAPDLELCRDLHASVLRWLPDDVTHHVVVPAGDLALFAPLRSARCQVWPVEAFLPRHVRQVPRTNVWVNTHRPWLPVRGWILQQVTKLAASTVLDADVLLFVDSDVVFVRPTSVQTFLRSGRLPLYRTPEGVDTSLPSHLRWHDTARRLLGLPPAPQPPLPDYISPLTAWDAATATSLLATVESATGRSWADALTGELHLSEYILYGVFADEVHTGPQVHVDTMRCHNYWHERPLDQLAGARFLDEMSPDDVAVMISAKSGTPLDVRQHVLAAAGGPRPHVP